MRFVWTAAMWMGLGGVLAIVACGGAPAAPAQPGDAVVTELRAVSTLSAAPRAQLDAAPNSALWEAELWSYLPKDEENNATLDLAGARRSSLKSIVDLAAEFMLTKQEGACAFSLFERVDGAAIAARGARPKALALRVHGPVREWMECAAKAEGEPLQMVAGRPTLASGDLLTITAVSESVVLCTFGARASVPAAPAAGRPPMLGAGLLFKAEGRLDGEIERAQLTLRAQPDSLALSLRSTLASEATAQTVQKLFNGLTTDKDYGQTLRELLKLDVHGRELNADFAYVGNQERQAAGVAELVAIAQKSVQTYILRAKQAEARNSLGQMAKDGQAYFEESAVFDPKSRKSVRHASCPAAAKPVPAVPPRGTKYQSRPAEWEVGGFRDMKFVMNDPQYFSYSVERSADGRTCKYVAAGDLNGDGKVSRFELVAMVRSEKGKPDIMVVAPNIAETNPDE